MENLLGGLLVLFGWCFQLPPDWWFNGLVVLVSYLPSARSKGSNSQTTHPNNQLTVARCVADVLPGFSGWFSGKEQGLSGALLMFALCGTAMFVSHVGDGLMFCPCPESQVLPETGSKDQVPQAVLDEQEKADRDGK